MPIYEAAVDRRPEGTAVKLVHEELYTPDVQANKRVLRPVFEMLGLSMPQTPELDRLLDPAITKLNSEATYRMVPNAVEIDESLGSDRTGWLFDRPRLAQTVVQVKTQEKTHALRGELQWEGNLDGLREGRFVDAGAQPNPRSENGWLNGKGEGRTASPRHVNDPT